MYAVTFLIPLCSLIYDVHFGVCVREYRILVEDFFYMVSLILFYFDAYGEELLVLSWAFLTQPFRLMSKGGEVMENHIAPFGDLSCEVWEEVSRKKHILADVVVKRGSFVLRIGKFERT